MPGLTDLHTHEREDREAGGIRWTIKNGVVLDDRALMAEVVKMVEESKRGWIDPRRALFDPRRR